MHNYYLAVSTNLDKPSGAFSAYQISLAETDAPPTGRLRASRTVYNNVERREGVFADWTSVVAALARAVDAPYSVLRNDLTGEYVVCVVSAASEGPLRRVATSTRR